jgi:hypothetical protein
VASGNVTGLQQITFSPSKGNFRIYLVVNGSDIGEQFVGAQVRLNHFKLYTLESGI